MKNTERFFAASNGYGGFKSQFDELFSLDTHRKIYVIKGGPGTGKSTLMKKVLNDFKDENITEIYCSSDHRSLDGAIIEKGGISVALLDGTSPHTYDPTIPGLAEILDTGKGVKGVLAEEKRTTLTELYNEKKKAYKKAYSLLRAAGEIFNNRFDKNEIFRSYSEAESFALEISDVKRDGRNRCKNQSLHRSAFGNGGYFTLQTASDKEIVEVESESPYFKEAVMRSLKDILMKKGALKVTTTSPLTEELTDGLYTDTTVFFADMSPKKIMPSIAPREETKIYNELLEKARDSFASASSLHFEMEAIFKEITDFTRCEKLYSKASEEIQALLFSQ